MNNTIEKAVLVYQGGIANVFAVDRFSPSPEGRNARRLMQHAFGPCEWYCRGLIVAGVQVTSAHCNQAGDIKDLVWSEDVPDAPFFESMNPVYSS